MEDTCEGLGAAVDSMRAHRVGLIANQTAVAEDLSHLVDILREGGVDVVALYGPEHGFYGEQVRRVASDTDPRTSLPVYSLFGEHRKPTSEMLQDVDTLVFSIQDVGVRFYTYISTMVHCMEAATEKGIPFFVIDRPNPITGVRLEGNVSEPEFQSFVAVRPLPIRHGMTIGELARLFNEAFEIGALLTVARMPAWDRTKWYDKMGLAWVMPSPAMPTLTTATVYPGACLFEGTNVSEGRGTTRPFELIGAPWIDGFRLSDAMNTLGLPGVFFRPVYFVPAASKYEGERCAGVQIHVRDREGYEPVRAAIHLMAEMRRMHPDAFKFREEKIDRLFGTDQVRGQIESGMSAEEIVVGWVTEREQFEQLRENYLLYP